MRRLGHELSVRLGVTISVVIVGFLLIGGRADAEGPAPEPVSYRVEAGDTLWEIAATVTGPEQDLRRVVSEIRRLNALEGATIHPGQVILIPGDLS